MILAIAAMEEEYQELEKMMVDAKEGVCEDVKYHLGKIADKEVMLMLSGVGKVNAAYALTTILNYFDVSFIVNIGSAGGVVKDYDVNVLDIVIAKKVCYHDVDLTLANRLPGVLPNTPQYFEATLTDEMLKAIDSTGLNYHCATIASGDQFVCDLDSVKYITETFEDVCACEMEAGAIAHIAYLRKIPFVVFRSISDVVGKEQDNQMQFEEYIKQASLNSSLAAAKIIEKI
ncbi:adenosylhomocysteine nucleosidase [Bacilli bacterium PM5-3]|nr:adenosylhomocysteine nucleosidase [Bacilli bacterium PM5-3]MDH6603945.1 adenosylhomocysteine nucleosidase [Bacilli bacterium PM5-9]